jgi:hypothetical protein
VERISWVGVLLGLFGAINIKDIKMTWLTNFINNLSGWQIILYISLIVIVISTLIKIRRRYLLLENWVYTQSAYDSMQYENLEHKINHLSSLQLRKAEEKIEDLKRLIEKT